MRSSVLELLEAGVGLERFRNVFRSLSTDAVILETASKSQKGTSMATDSRIGAGGGALERLQG